MLSHEMWWKRVFRHLKWTNDKKMRTRYPDAYKVLDKLYEKDRSWTFNSRLEEARKLGDYDGMLVIYEERPNLLLRNFLYFLRYPGKDWIMDTMGNFLRRTKPSIKTLWQIVEETEKPENHKPQSVRIVQGVRKEYNPPLPALKKKTTKKAVKKILEYIREVKTEENKKLGKVWLDKELLSRFPIQYSGANSNDNQTSGKYYPEGYEIKLPERGIYRLGLAWKDIGNGSADIDLSSSVIFEDGSVEQLFYGRPELFNKGGELLGVSSGDKQTSTTNKYSVEFIDIDLKKMRKAGVKKIISSVWLYRANTDGLRGNDCHIFFKYLEKKKMRKIESNNIVIDMQDQDYAVKSNSEKQGAIGVVMDFEKDTLEFVMAEIDTDMVNVYHGYNDLMKVLDGLPRRKKVGDMVPVVINEEYLVDDPKLADTTIGGDGCDVDVFINMEKLKEIVF